MKSVDIIAAVRNEEKYIPIFVKAIQELQLPRSILIGIIFVEDSSTDNTVAVLRELTKAHDNVRFYSLKEGFGEGPAVVFGMSRSSAEAVIMMDVDEGHPVSVIPKMIDLYLNGADVVQAVRITLKDRKIYRDVGAALFRILARAITGVNMKEQNVYFRLVSREYKSLLVDTKKWIHFLRMKLPQNSTVRLRKVCFHAEERKLGKSKYNFLRLTKLSLDGILSLVSVSRLIFIVFLLVAVSLTAALISKPVFSIPFVLIAILIILRYYRISHNDILSKLEIKEEA